jgi:hypothetical protein
MQRCFGTMTVDSGTKSERSLGDAKQRVSSEGGNRWKRGFWYSHPWSVRYTRLTSTFADFSGIRFTHLRQICKYPFGPRRLKSSIDAIEVQRYNRTTGYSGVTDDGLSLADSQY